MSCECGYGCGYGCECGYLSNFDMDNDGDKQHLGGVVEL